MLIPANYSLNLNRTSQIFSQSDSKHLLSLDYSRPNQTRQDFLIHFFLQNLIWILQFFLLMLNLQNYFCMVCSNLLKHLIMQKGKKQHCFAMVLHADSGFNEVMGAVSLSFALGKELGPFKYNLIFHEWVVKLDENKLFLAQ